MIITYHGAECFKISQGDTTLALNQISKDSKFKPTRFGADITLITTNHPDFNGRDQTSRGDKSSFVIDSPGEYEIKDVFIKGFLSEGLATGRANVQSGKKINTIYLITFEGMTLCFLGALTETDLSDEILEAIENIDILFVPIDGDSVKDGGKMLDPVSAYKPLPSRRCSSERQRKPQAFIGLIQHRLASSQFGLSRRPLPFGRHIGVDRNDKCRSSVFGQRA